MEYLALYRKYRPSDIDDVVDQNEVKQILASSIKNNTITHAYLFSGPRGTGKTTMAKILAKMVNCLHPVDGHPCCKCENCLNLFNSNDIVEIDAASNNGVDEIRDLREKATLVPSMCKYKVYIIDEVHMLTTQAFNALLKILEEPPKHIIFILATTEYYKIPLTITSRCQKFQFSKISDDSIVGRLKYISEKENIEISDEALYEIAKLSDGGLRDSINFLDQLRSSTDNEISIQDVYNVCGNISSAEIVDLLVNVRKNDYLSVSDFFEKMNLNGKNYSKFFEDISLFLRDVILYKSDSSLKKNNYEDMKKISEVYSCSDIFLVVDCINKLIDRLKFVSKQSVVVVNSFFLLMNNLNDKGNELLESNDDDCVIENKIQFSVKKDDSKLTLKNVNNVEKISNDNLKVDDKKNDFSLENYRKNDDIIINNAFAVADKKLKSDLQEIFSKLDNYLTDNKYASICGLLIDTELQVVGDNYIVLSAKYDAIIDKIYRNYHLCDDFLKQIFGKKYYFVIISPDKWDKLKNEYIENIKKGKKYYLMNIDSEIIDTDILNNEPSFVDKLFSIVGEDVVEFK